MGPGAAPGVRDRRTSPTPTWQQAVTASRCPPYAPPAPQRSGPRLRPVRPGSKGSPAPRPPHRGARPHYSRSPALGGRGGRSRGAAALGLPPGRSPGEKEEPAKGPAAAARTALTNRRRARPATRARHAAAQSPHWPRRGTCVTCLFLTNGGQPRGSAPRMQLQRRVRS